MVRLFQSLLTLMGALAVLTVGALPAMAQPDHPPPSCHEMSAHGVGHETPEKAPAHSMKAMACCALCVTTPVPPPAAATEIASADKALPPLPALSMIGLTPSPEPDPPRG